MAVTADRRAFNNLLLVEDDASQLWTLSKLLQQQGLEVICCLTAKEAIEQLDREGFAVAILDLQLSDGDGTNLFETIHVSCPETRIIVHTGFGSYETAKKAVDHGVYAYIEKGGDPAVLMAKVHQATKDYLADSLRQHDVQLRLITDNLPALIAYVDADQRYRFANPTYAQWYGRSVREVIGRRVSEVVGERAYQVLEGRIEQVLAGESIAFETWLTRPDEARRCVSSQYVPHFGTNEQAQGLFVLATDITERKRAEEALCDSEQQLRLITENVQAFIAHIDSSHCYRFVNKRYAEVIGFGQEEIIGCHVKDVLGQPAYDAIREHIESALSGEHVEFEAMLPFKSGKSIWVRATYAPDFVGPKSVQGVYVLSHDITDRKQAELALKESEAQFRALAENSPAMIVIYRETRRLYVNPATETITGYSKDELLRMNLLDVVHPDFRELVRDRNLQRHRGEAVPDRYEVKLRTKRGDERWIDLSTTAIEYGGKPAFLANAIDITEKKRSEKALQISHRQLETTLAELKQTQQQVIQQERLRAVGQMAGGVAHDLNNSLSPVLGYAEMLASAPDLPEKLREWALLIETGARDAAAVVERLREFYRPQDEDEVDRQAVNLRELMTQIPQLTRPKWRDEAQRTGRNIDVELDLESEPFVHGTPAELREVLTNLVFNAVDAMPSGGKITLHLSSTPECAVIEVTDTGIGMLDDVASRCFEPFFTAKGSGGTGLGLSVCHGIVQRHGGRFEIDTEPGHGTTMRIILRLAVQDELAEREEPIVAALPSRRVLYIDDDLRLRQLVSTLLEELGQKVDLAKSGAEGLELFQQNQYDVVLTDLGMPGIDGREVTRIIKTTRQDVPVIMVTGWGSPSLQQRVDGAVEPDQLVPKPLTLAKLREALEKAYA